MKKFTLTLFAFATVTLIGCRQQEELFTNEDSENLLLLKKISNSVNADSAQILNKLVEGDPAPPPKK